METMYISVELKHYEELVAKAKAFDIITEDIKSKIDTGDRDYNLVNDAVVLAVTGMRAYKRIKNPNQEDAD